MTEKDNHPNVDQQALEQSPYLFDDDELVQALEKEYERDRAAKQLPDDELRLQRNWRQLEAKQSSRPGALPTRGWWLPMAALLAVAIAWPLLQKEDKDQQLIQSKSGEQTVTDENRLKLQVDWKDDQQVLIELNGTNESNAPRYFGILIVAVDADGEASAGMTIWHGKISEWHGPFEPRIQDLGLPEASSYRFCLITADSESALQSKLQISLENVAMLADELCD